MTPADPVDPAPAEEVRAANTAFYATFEARAAGAMATLWAHDDGVSCTHPGWPILRGWPSVQASWEGILRNAQHLQFIVTGEVVQVHGDVGWVTCVENLIDDGGPRGTVAAINLFRREPDGRWLLVAHHGSPVVARLDG